MLPVAVVLLAGSYANSAVTAPGDAPRLASTAALTEGWQRFEIGGVTVVATGADQGEVPGVSRMTAAARGQVEDFFGRPFPSAFEVTIYPDRASLDAYWRKAWSMPDFSSQCWMVASGTADGLRLLSPRTWAAEACEHNAADNARVQALITHEIAHVFHGQNLPDQSFDGMDDVAWFVEGLATYVSGQLELGYLAPASEAIAEGKAPAALSSAWSGKFRYGVCGSIVRFIDSRQGRPGLLEMLPLKTEAELLGAVGLSEDELLAAWRASVAPSLPGFEQGSGAD
jgi:hypothetical protein